MTKLIFEKLSVRNFLSVGNIPIEVDLNKTGTSYVYGENGTGKTAIFFDAISFALDGKLFRDVKKAQIPNFVNRKNCSVSLEMTLNNDRVHVTRTISPDTFVVTVNGQEKWSDLNVTMKQNEFKEMIGLSRNVMSMLMFIGADNQPFMERTPAQRKEFVERVLNLEIFSTMNDIAKQRIKQIGSDMSAIETDLRTERRLIDEYKELLTKCAKPDQEKIEKLQEYIKKGEAALKKKELDFNSFHSKLENLNIKIDELLFQCYR